MFLLLESARYGKNFCSEVLLKFIGEQAVTKHALTWDNPVVQTIAREVEKVGGTVLIPPHDKSTHSVSRLVINGRMCTLHCVHSLERLNPARGRQRPFWRVQLVYTCVKQVEAEICHVSAEGLPTRLFVIPSSVVLEKLFGETPTPHKHMYLPTDRRPPYKNHRQKVDYWQYENAFHLLCAPREQRLVA